MYQTRVWKSYMQIFFRIASFKCQAFTSSFACAILFFIIILIRRLLRYRVLKTNTKKSIWIIHKFIFYETQYLTDTYEIIKKKGLERCGAVCTVTLVYSRIPRRTRTRDSQPYKKPSILNRKKTHKTINLVIKKQHMNFHETSIDSENFHFDFNASFLRKLKRFSSNEPLRESKTGPKRDPISSRTLLMLERPRRNRSSGSVFMGQGRTAAVNKRIIWSGGRRAPAHFTRWSSSRLFIVQLWPTWGRFPFPIGQFFFYQCLKFFRGMLKGKVLRFAGRQSADEKCNARNKRENGIFNNRKCIGWRKRSTVFQWPRTYLRTRSIF